MITLYHTHTHTNQDDSASTTVADVHSKHNFENQAREICNFTKHKEAFVHVAVPYDWWNPFNGEPELLKEHHDKWKVYRRGDVGKAYACSIVYALLYMLYSICSIVYAL